MLLERQVGRHRAISAAVLKAKHTSFGTRSDSPEVDSVIVYSKINDGKVQSLRVFGEQCPVDGNGEQLTWLGDVDQTKVLDWLEEVAALAQA